MPRAFRTFLRDWVLLAALPVWLVITFLVMIAHVDGTSMEPTYHSRDVLLLHKWPRWLHAWGLREEWPRRGDIVVFKGPAGHEESYARGLFGLRYRPYLIKRVVGVAGDTVELREGRLYRDGRPVAESYTTGAAGLDAPAVRVPPGAVYVLGDNRRLGESIDSRHFGPVELSDVAGTTGARLWSPGSY